MAAGRVSGDAELFEIEFGKGIVFMREQGVVGAADVLKCSGPAAAGIADATVFDVPGCDADFFQRGTKMPGISEIVLRAPVAAVDEEDNGMRTFSRGKANVDELIRVLPIRETQIGIGRFLFQDGFALHAKQYRTAARSGDVCYAATLPRNIR